MNQCAIGKTAAGICTASSAGGNARVPERTGRAPSRKLSSFCRGSRNIPQVRDSVCASNRLVSCFCVRLITAHRLAQYKGRWESGKNTRRQTDRASAFVVNPVKFFLHFLFDQRGKFVCRFSYCMRTCTRSQKFWGRWGSVPLGWGVVTPV